MEKNGNRLLDKNINVDKVKKFFSDYGKLIIPVSLI